MIMGITGMAIIGAIVTGGLIITTGAMIAGVRMMIIATTIVTTMTIKVIMAMGTSGITTMTDYSCPRREAGGNQAYCSWRLNTISPFSDASASKK
ncbi:protein [Klebsiella pneumoniae]|nr:protein [Klebsiella pneumoniae]